MTTTPATVHARPGAEYIPAQGAHYAVAPFTIRRAFGTLRRAGAAYLEANHYMRASGGSGQLFVVESGDGQIAGACLIGATASRNCDRSIAGACLIGPAPSKDAERSIAGDGVLIRQIKRSHLLDSVPKESMCESQLLRYAMQSVCNEYDRPVMFALTQTRPPRTSAPAFHKKGTPL